MLDARLSAVVDEEAQRCGRAVLGGVDARGQELALARETDDAGVGPEPAAELRRARDRQQVLVQQLRSGGDRTRVRRIESVLVEEPEAERGGVHAPGREHADVSPGGDVCCRGAALEDADLVAAGERVERGLESDRTGTEDGESSASGHG
jgi:hypothetical protein